ncbi:hypothetical protein G3O08_20650, partial [Cryomorpha ignava]
IVGPIDGNTDAEVSIVGENDQSCFTSGEFAPATFCPPSNDEACNATPIFCGDTIVQNYQGATLSETCGGGSGVADVWFIFTADGTQTYTIADVGPGFFDAVVGLYQGDDCGNLVSVAPCADSPESYSVTAAGTYYFYIRPWSIFTTNLTGNVSLTCTPFDCPGVGNIGDACDDGDAGTVNDEISADCECVGTPQVANDEACTAISLACGDSLSGLSFDGSTQSFDDACFGSGTGDVWFSFVADGLQVYEISETSSSNVVVDLWIGDECGDLTNVLSCSDNPETLTVGTAGTYYFRVRPFSTATTLAVELNCIDFAANDEACSATALACGDTLSGLSFAGATQSFDDECTGSGTADVWMSFVSDGTQTYEIAEISSSNVVIDLWSGDDCGNLTAVTDCENFPETIEVIDAGTYYFRIRPFSTATTYAVTLICTDFDCPDLSNNIGNACDDGDSNTVND